MIMERHGGGGDGDGDGDGDGKRIGCDEMDLELSLASRELRERPPEDPLQSVPPQVQKLFSFPLRQLRERPLEDPPLPVVSRELRELPPQQLEQRQQQQQQSFSPSLSLPLEQQKQPSLSSEKSVLFRKLQPLRSSRSDVLGLRAGAAAALSLCRRHTPPPTLRCIEAVPPNRQPPGFSAVTPRARTRIAAGHVHRSVEQTEFFQSAQVITPASLPARPPIEAVRPAFAAFFESVYPNGQPTRPPASSLAPPPVDEVRPPPSIRRPPAPPPAAPPPIETVRPPFPWAGDRPATVRSIDWLRANGITHIRGEVRCGGCGVQKVISYELESKVRDTMQFIFRLRHYLDDRTKLGWSKEDLLPCDSCGGSKCVGPVIPARDEDINWLFMLLGQTLGALSLVQLKYFCRHRSIHRTGAKNRLLFDVYVELCRQLFPNGKINTNQKNDK